MAAATAEPCWAASAISSNSIGPCPQCHAQVPPVHMLLAECLFVNEDYHRIPSKYKFLFIP